MNMTPLQRRAQKASAQARSPRGSPSRSPSRTRPGSKAGVLAGLVLPESDADGQQQLSLQLEPESAGSPAGGAARAQSTTDGSEQLQRSSLRLDGLEIYSVVGALVSGTSAAMLQHGLLEATAAGPLMIGLAGGRLPDSQDVILIALSICVSHSTAVEDTGG